MRLFVRLCVIRNPGFSGRRIQIAHAPLHVLASISVRVHKCRLVLRPRTQPQKPKVSFICQWPTGPLELSAAQV